MFNKSGRSAARVKHRVCRDRRFAHRERRLASAEMAEPRRECRRRSASQAPFRRTGGVLAYLGRYTVANTRLIRLNDLCMPFNQKDHRRGGHSIA
jgi:hypothetical protein